MYPNNKSYVTKYIKNTIKRKVAFKNKESTALEETEKELRSKLKNAKLIHRQHLEDAFKANNPKRVWDIIKSMSGMSSLAIVTENEASFANDLNKFFARFESSDNSLKCIDILC